MLEILAPGESDLVAFLECYFDESGSHKGSPVLAVAGYVYEKEACKALDLGWKGVLDQFNLPYFRMSACAHRQPPFDRLTPDECILVEKAMIRLIAENALYGIASVVDEGTHSEWFKHDNFFTIKSAYTYCCWQLIGAIGDWVHRIGFDGEIAYFFEAGHAFQSQANALMQRIFEHPRLTSMCRYASHSFVDKRRVRPVQSADLLAWLIAAQVKRKLAGTYEFRKDLKALEAKPPHRIISLDAGDLDALQKAFRSKTGVTGHYDGFPFWCPFDPAKPFGPYGW